MKYLQAVLTVIAVCLVLITFAVTGILPVANARESNPRFISVPVNADGSINVKIVKGQTMDVNIEKVGGNNVWGSGLPVTTNSTLDVNIKQVNNRSAYYPLDVKIDK